MKWNATVMILCILGAGCDLSKRWNPGEAGGYEQLVLPSVTQTKSGKPGDPINVGFVGDVDELVGAFVAAGWFPADGITLRTSVRLVRDVVLKKSDPDAPVSNLYLWGRPQDIAFEHEVNGSPRQRHHVRLWLSEVTADGRPLWIGAATYDRGIYLRKFSHHIAADIDSERAYIFASLTNVNLITRTIVVPGVGRSEKGRNGEDDPYFTDGQLHVGCLIPNATEKSGARN